MEEIMIPAFRWLGFAAAAVLCAFAPLSASASAADSRPELVVAVAEIPEGLEPSKELSNNVVVHSESIFFNEIVCRFNYLAYIFSSVEILKDVRDWRYRRVLKLSECFDELVVVLRLYVPGRTFAKIVFSTSKDSWEFWIR